MSSKLPRHREPRSPGWFDNDIEDRGRGRRPRSTSRDQKTRPQKLEKERRHGGDIDSTRSSTRRKKHEDSSHRNRSRSVDNRHADQEETSLHKSRRHRRSQSPRHSSHRHKRRHGSGSPEHKRRRSRSPGGHSSGKHKKSRRHRSRSKSPSNSKYSRRGVSPESKYESPESFKLHPSKTAARQSRYRERSTSGSPSCDVNSRHMHHEYHSRSPLKREQSLIRSQPNVVPRSPRRQSPPPGKKTRYMSPPHHRERSPIPHLPKSTARGYPPITSRRRSSRSISPPYHDSSEGRARSPGPVYPPSTRGRSPIAPQHPRAFKRSSEFSPPSRVKSPRRSSPPQPSSKLSRQPLHERGTRDSGDYENPNTRVRRKSPEMRQTPRRLSHASDHASGRSPIHELDNRHGRQYSTSPKYSKNANEDDQISPRYSTKPGSRHESSPYISSDRGRGRGLFDSGRGTPRGRGRGRGHDHHRNQPSNGPFNGYTPRGRGGYRGRGEASPFPHSKHNHREESSPKRDNQQPTEAHSSHQSAHPHDHLEFERRPNALFPPRGPRGGYRRGRGRGRGGRLIDVRESSVEPPEAEEPSHNVVERDEMEHSQSNINGLKEGSPFMENTTNQSEEAVDSDPPPPPPSPPPPPPPPPQPSDPNTQDGPPAPGPFKRLPTVESPVRPSPPAEPKNSSFRPFTMNLPAKTPKVSKPGLVPKALEAVGRKFATGSNSSPLGGQIDLSARLGRSKQPPPPPPELRITRNIRELRDTRYYRDRRDTRDFRDIRTPYREPHYRSRARHQSPPIRLPSPPRRSPSPPPVPPAPQVIIRDMPIYQKVSMVGEGTYGKVYKATNNLTKELVALKRIRMESERDGFPVTAVREMKLLQALKHENIVSLLEMMVDKSDFYMVFDYLDHDLTGILNHPTFRLELCHIKDLAKQFFGALHYLHHRGVLHRDIKGSNILLSCDGQLKIADFGLARFYAKNSKELDYTNRVITLWYRPPEILLGATAYGPAVDMWSAACVFIELFTRSPVFPGRTEIDQLDTIYKVLGRPTEKLWPALKSMPWYLLLQPKGMKKKNKFRELYEKKIPPSAMDLILELLQYDPEKRPTAEECLQHVYFSEEPAPQKPSGLKDITGDWHEYESKMERRKERDNQKKRHEAQRKKAKEDREAERERKQTLAVQEYDPARTIESLASDSIVQGGQIPSV